MVIHYIVDFTSYLNTKEFSISHDQITRFFCMMQDAAIDFTKQEDTLELMKIVFCTNRKQCELLPDYFQKFLKEKSNDILITKMEQDRNQSKENLTALTRSKQSEIQQIQKEIDTITQEIRAGSNGLKKLLKKEETQLIQEHLDLLKKLKLNNKKGTKFIKECIVEEDIEKFATYSSNFINSVADELIPLGEKALKKGKIEEFSFYQKLFNIMKRLVKLADRHLKAMDAEIKKATSSQVDKIASLEKEIEKEQKKHQEIQNQLNQMLYHTQMMQKENTVHHREHFIGKNAVQLTQKEDTPEYMKEEFKKLDQASLNSIYYYIRKNLLKFKTRITRNINTKERRQIDMKATIQHACKTGGLPLSIYYEKPKANKTKLVLILDVSGSCKEASEMMLSFMYLLQSVFPGGCKTFAFVDSLYDISDIMASYQIQQSIEDVLKVIPRKGVYSNYYKPLVSLWEENRHEITSDSIVIFMGDARNNRNPTGIEYIKNISRKAKKAYWLNTEPFEKWGKADSLAFEYAKFFKMYEVLNATDIVQFINEM